MRGRAKIGLIDYGSGNLRSVAKALQAAGAEPEQIASAPIPVGLDALVLPGVGSFGDSVRHLQERGLFWPIREWLTGPKKFLGICLGYQLLFQTSEESPGVEGLGLFAGRVQRFRAGNLKVPQIGWNRLTWTKEAQERYPGLPDNPYVYFVHSYYPVPEDRSIIAATAEYGDEFAAAVLADNLLATQFHPEKSQENGLAILRQFVSSLT
ncbi:MAG: imidazole glycerol phosphate synthase subunit HisH [Verrucomicrobia bacterium]|nr:imidazole glycerol phosphate synthase subunit HisH [Verrucomicrobiota bacterium]MBV9130932.1 imidazole glycerol phosphate synthase subunit HisH [Verrucomicrobiota bacterium]